MEAEWILVAVTIGAFAQATTGMGFGIVAGPFLIYVYGYHAGMLGTAALAAIVSLIMALKDRRFIETATLRVLAWSFAPGALIAAGIGALLSPNALSLAFGTMLTLIGISLSTRSVRSRSSTIPSTAHHDPRSIELIGAGVVAGTAGYLFGAPGPVAAWSLGRTSLSPLHIRATLSAYFVLSYAAVIAGFLMKDGLPPVGAGANAVPFVLCCATGLIGGLALGDRLSERTLKLAWGLLITSSGVLFLIAGSS